MQKMFVYFLSVILLIFILNSPAHAYNAVDKLTRGAINLLVSPLEFFQGIADAVSKHDPAVGLPVGICYGLWNTTKRAGIGIYEIITFPLPVPPDYAPIIEEPKFFEKAKQEQ